MNDCRPDGAADVLIDGCAVNRFALVNVDPFKELAGSGLELAITPALEREYRAAFDHLFVPSYVKALIRKLLDGCKLIAGPGGRLSMVAADDELAALARVALVITDDAKLYRRWATERPRLVAWATVEAHLKNGDRLAELLRRRANQPDGRSKSG